MLKIYDKAQWHIDAGEEPTLVIARLNSVFKFLSEKELLTAEGKEILELGVDSSVSIHERMLTEAGNAFMDSSYDKVINKNAEDILDALEKEFSLNNEN